MPRLSDLWDVNKYSEGDPIRQLIAASQAYKDWPTDALAWGADLIDLGTGALSKLSNGERRNQIKTDLGGNLRRALSTPRGERGMSSGPAPDVEAGRSVGRMLNPALLMQGEVPGSRALSSFQLRKRLSDAVPINKTRRAFFAGKEEAMAKPANEDVVAALSPLAEAGQEIARTPVDRRDFLKGSAALGGAAVGGGLLGKFGRAGEAVERAPEALRGAKIAEEIPKGWESTQGGAYRYHSLKDYLDDVEKYVDHTSYENGVKLANKHLDSFDPINPSEYDKFVNNHMRSTRNDLTKQRLLDDEEYYKIAKGELKTINDPEWNLYYDNAATQRMKDEVNAFSPQAKQEMKALKSMHGDDWVNQIQSSEFRHYLDSFGIIQGRPQYYGDRMMPSKEFYWNGKVPIDTEYEHLNPKSGGFNFWDETGGHGLSNGTNTLEELQQAIQNYERDFL